MSENDATLINHQQLTIEFEKGIADKKKGTEEINTLKARIQNEKQKIEQLEQEIDQMAKMPKNSSKIQQKNMALKSEVKSLSLQIDEDQTKVSEAKKIYLQCKQACEDQVKERKKEEKQKQKALDDLELLKERITQFQKMEEDEKIREDEKSELENKIQALKREIENERGNLEKKRADFDYIANGINVKNELDNQIDDFRHDLRSIKKKISDISEKINQQETNKSKLIDEIEKMKAKHAKMQIENEKLKQKIKKQNSNMKKLEKNILIIKDAGKQKIIEEKEKLEKLICDKINLVQNTINLKDSEITSIQQGIREKELLVAQVQKKIEDENQISLSIKAQKQKLDDIATIVSNAGKQIMEKNFAA